MRLHGECIMRLFLESEGHVLYTYPSLLISTNASHVIKHNKLYNCCIIIVEEHNTTNFAALVEAHNETQRI